jgi:2-phosphosulfolactate phosphatase
MTQRPSVVVDCFPDSVKRYREGYAIVAIDVIRATTTAVTAVSLGRRCFPVPSIEHALPIAARLDQPLLVGELGGNMPYGFDLTNSPAELSTRTDVSRPIILLSSSGTQMIHNAGECDAVYIACLRNAAAVVEHVADRHRRVAVIGAGTRGEFREEDQYCCAVVAAGLLERGFAPEDQQTRDVVERWRGKPVDSWLASKSVEYLRKSGQLRDLDFILAHVEDVPATFMLKHGEVVRMAIEE